MRPHKGLTEPDWSYTYGLVLLGFQRLYQETGNEAYLNYAKTWVDSLIDENGNIKDYVIYEFNIDDINAGKLLFMFYEQTQDPRYLKAMQQLRQQLDWQPRRWILAQAHLPLANVARRTVHGQCIPCSIRPHFRRRQCCV